MLLQGRSFWRQRDTITWKVPAWVIHYLKEVERALASILEHPEAVSVIRGRVRRKLIRKFPYGILYSVVPNGIRTRFALWAVGSASPLRL
jgi:plasmid stabilization system protein ParE